MKNLTYLLLLAALYSCTPQMVIYRVNDTYHPTESYHPFAVIEQEEPFMEPTAIKVGEVQIKDNVLSFGCDYETIRNMAVDEAKFMGGNCLRITNVWTPQSRSGCHRITADVFHINNPEEYESEIFWHKYRKLEIADFKGSSKRKPYVAMTAGMIRYYIMGRTNASVNIETVFDCSDSYFKHTENDELTLAHEQLHFDIAELYARKFAQRLQHQVNSYQMLLAKHQLIYMEVFKELQKKQEEYDGDVYEDPTLLSKWQLWVSAELARYEEYEDKQLHLLL